MSRPFTSPDWQGSRTDPSCPAYDYTIEYAQEAAEIAERERLRGDTEECAELMFDAMTKDIFAPLVAGDKARFADLCEILLEQAIEKKAAEAAANIGG